MNSGFNGSVVYQVYPRSFQDSNNDGIGDIAGIISRIDYLKNLGIDYIWLNPVYLSPMKDNGYDIDDYRSIDPIFGTMTDFDMLISAAHERNIRIIMDLVPNHTSDQHAWFLESGASRHNAKSDWYIWRDKSDVADGLPNNWLARFGGSVWEWCEERQQFYLHSFLKQQPDLNWENPEVRAAFAGIMQFWMDKGVDGFRVDAIDLMGKDSKYLSEPVNPNYNPEQDIEYDSLLHIYTRDAGNFFEYLNFIVDAVQAYKDKLIVLESWFIERANAALYHDFYRSINRPYCLPFNFELIFMDWEAESLQKFLDSFHAGLRETDLPAYMLGNHDVQRFASKVGATDARLGALLLLTLPGVSFIYNGDELGMCSAELSPDDQTDPDGRDPYRTPMQWSSSNNAGFSSAKPWLPVAQNYQELNAEQESANSASMLSLYRALIRLRHECNSLRDGNYEPGPILYGGISFRRISENDESLILINISNQECTVALDGQYECVLAVGSAPPQTKNSEYNGQISVPPHAGFLLKRYTI